MSNANFSYYNAKNTIINVTFYLLVGHVAPSLKKMARKKELIITLRTRSSLK